MIAASTLLSAIRSPPRSSTWTCGGHRDLTLGGVAKTPNNGLKLLVRERFAVNERLSTRAAAYPGRSADREWKEVNSNGEKSLAISVADPTNRLLTN